MNRRHVLVGVVVFLCTSFAYSNNIFAVGSGGFRNEVVDAEAMGKASAFVAQADNPSAIHYNPAGLTQLKGSYLSIGYTAEFPVNEVDSNTGDGTVQMQRQYFLIPNFYYVTDLGKGGAKIGVGVTAPYGLGTDWAHDSYVAENATESDVEFININPTIAYKINDTLSIGAGLDVYDSEIEKRKRLDNAALSSNGDFKLEGSDTALGYNVGFLIKPMEGHSIGLSYRSEVDMEYRGTITLTNIEDATALFVFGGSTYTTDMKTELTLPQSLAIGYAYKPNDKWTFEADVEWTDWSSIKQDLVEYPSLAAGDSKLIYLNDGNPAAKDWTDVFAFGFGTEYQATDKLELRCGYLYEQTPIPSATFDSALPGANRHGITLGAGYDFKDVKVDVSYMFLAFRDRDITNDVGSNTGANINGKYKAHVNIFAVGFTYKF